MGERILIEEGPDMPHHYHFVVQRSLPESEENRKAAEALLVRNGSTYVYHKTDARPLAHAFSYGVVEPLAVVSQRIAKVTR